MRKPDTCAKKKCGWSGTDDQKVKKRNHRYKLPVYDLVCPKCGGKEFYPGEEVEE